MVRQVTVGERTDTQTGLEDFAVSLAEEVVLDRLATVTTNNFDACLVVRVSCREVLDNVYCAAAPIRTGDARTKAKKLDK